MVEVGGGGGEGQTFQRSLRIFLTLSTSKVERNRGKVYFVVRESVQVVRLFRIPSKMPLSCLRLDKFLSKNGKTIEPKRRAFD